MGKGTMGKVGHRNQISLILLLLAACALFYSDLASAAAEREAEIFERAFGLYLDYRPEKAAALFSVFLREFPESSARDAALFWQAMSLLQVGKAKEARLIFLKVRDEFPESMFKGFAVKQLEEAERGGTEAQVIVNGEKGKRNETRNGKSQRCEEALRKSEGKRKEVEIRAAEILKKNKLLVNDLSKALEMKGSAEVLLTEAKKKLETAPDCRAVREEKDKLQDETKALGARLKTSEERASGLMAEKDDAVTMLKAVSKERDDAVASLKEIEARFPDASEVAMRLSEREKFQKEQDEYIKKLKEDVRALSEGIKDRDKRLSEADKTIASIRVSTKGPAREDKGEAKGPGGVSGKALQENEEIVRLRRASEEKDKEIAGLRAGLADREKDYSDRDSQLKKLSDDNAEYERKLKENETVLSDLRRIKGEYEKLKEEKDKTAPVKPADSGESLAKLEKKYLELREAHEALMKRNSETEADVASVRSRLLRYESPVVRIGEEGYSRYQILEENIVSLKVLAKIGADPEWRSGDAYEDFITEGVLWRMASEEDKKKILAAAGPLVKKYAFDDAEAGYLAKYMVMEELIKKQRSGDVVDEKAISDYYEANKADYRTGGGERYVKYLGMKFTRADKAGGVSLVSQIQREVMNGKSFEDVYKARSDKLSLKRIKVEDLPTWIGEKIQVLKDGEVSSIFTEDQFIMLQMQSKKPGYRKYEDVKGEIRQKLLQGRKGPFDLRAWLKDIRKEAVLTR